MSSVEKILQRAVKSMEALLGAQFDAMEASTMVAESLDKDALVSVAASYIRGEYNRQKRSKVLKAEREVTQLSGRELPLRYAETQAHMDKEAREREPFDLHGHMNEIVLRYKNEIKAEWTEELLSQSIHMPDGTETTWGDASMAQHELRMDMFMKNATANIEGAARHKKAIEDLRLSGRSTLSELVSA